MIFFYKSDYRLRNRLHNLPHTHKYYWPRSFSHYLRADEFIEVRGDVEADSVDGSGQSDPPEEQDEQHEVGISGGEIHHLRERGEQEAIFKNSD